MKKEKIRKMKDKFRGALVGCAVGDAVGLFYQYNFFHHKALPGEFIRHRGWNFFEYQPIAGHPPGQYTDDTQMTLAIARSLINKGRADGEDIARQFRRLWESGEIVGQGASCHDAVTNLIKGMKWDESGTEEGRAGNGTAMRASPIGLFYHDRPEEIDDAAKTSSIITHTDSRATAGAVITARAAAFAINNDNIDICNFIDYLYIGAVKYNEELAEYLKEIPQWMKMEDREAFYRMAWAGYPERGARENLYISGFVAPTVLYCLYSFLKADGDFSKALFNAVAVEGDIDTTGAITGALAGAYAGMEAIPENLADGVLNVDEVRRAADEMLDRKTSF